MDGLRDFFWGFMWAPLLARLWFMFLSVWLFLVFFFDSVTCKIE